MLGPNLRRGQSLGERGMVELKEGTSEIVCLKMPLKRRQRRAIAYFETVWLCKDLTVSVYFYFPLSLHHYCCIIHASLAKKRDVAKNDVTVVDFG